MGLLISKLSNIFTDSSTTISSPPRPQPEGDVECVYGFSNELPIEYPCPMCACLDYENSVNEFVFVYQAPDPFMVPLFIKHKLIDDFVIFLMKKKYGYRVTEQAQI